jgi:hypothetical protein
MDDEKDDLEYGDDSSHTETEELLFRPATAASRLSPVLKIAAAIIIGVIVFAVTLLSLDSQLRKTIIPKPLQAKTCMLYCFRSLFRGPCLSCSRHESHDTQGVADTERNGEARLR